MAIELQRYGCEVIAVDRYENAPAMQVANRSYVISMLDGDALHAVITKEKPDIILPEIEAIATDTLVELEKEGFKVMPTAKATRLTMDREGIRRLVAEELGIPTSPYKFAETFKDFEIAVKEIGIPCVVKPIMSSSGKGQSVIRSEKDIKNSWDYSQAGGRAGYGKVIVEGFIDFDYEITLLTIRSLENGMIKTSFCEPIGHIQVDGDYRESWQPHPMSPIALEKSQLIGEKVTNALGGQGIFGVELFIKKDMVYFSEVSPRPHDTGMVTLISQDLSEFALHARAVLGLPIPNIKINEPSASSALLVEGKSKNVVFSNLDNALSEVDTQLRLFGKPEVDGRRRMGVALAKANSIKEAREKALRVIEKIKVSM